MHKTDDIRALVEKYAAELNRGEWEAGKDWIPYSGPIFDADEYVAAIESLLSGWMIFGPKAREFELAFPDYLGKKYGSLANSGSSANLLMVSALTSKRVFDVPPGSKIITPAVCFPTTVNPIIQCGFQPVFVDVTMPDLNLDLDDVERVLTEDSNGDIRAMMFAHVLGNPPDMDRLMSIVDRYDLILLEDSCDALGSSYKGKKLGSFGHISTCSFFPAHHMTLGEGGFVASDDSATNKLVTSLRDWGRACHCNSMTPGPVVAETACGNRFGNWLPGHRDIVYDHRYVFSEIGYNLKPLDLQGAMGLEQLKKLPMLEEARRRNFARLERTFSPYRQHLDLPSAQQGADPSWFAYLISIKKDAPFSREQLLAHLENAKIQTRPYFAGNILAHPAYSDFAKQYGDLQDRFPEAAHATTHSFFLGTYAGLTEPKMAYIQEQVDRFFESL